MTAKYVGTRDRNWGEEKSRAVELGCAENEQTAFNRVCDLLRVKGWDIDNGVECWGLCRVEDKSEADEFIREWKAAKRCIINCIKFGF